MRILLYPHFLERTNSGANHISYEIPALIMNNRSIHSVTGGLRLTPKEKFSQMKNTSKILMALKNRQSHISRMAQSNLVSAGVIALCASVGSASAFDIEDDQSYFTLNGGYDHLQVDRENSSVQISVQVQLRYLFNTRSTDTDDDVTNGFESRRTKIKASGRLDNPDLSYALSMSLSRSTGEMKVRDVNARWDINDDWTLKFGQFRPTILREQDVSSKYQLGAERSLITGAFGQSYNRGVSVKYAKDKLRLTGSITDASDGTVGDNIWEYDIRGEAMLQGKHAQMSDFTSFRDDPPAVMLGMGVGFLDADPIDSSDEDSTLLTWTVDLSAEFGGSNINIAVVGTTFDEDGKSRVNSYGAIIQGGFFITDRDELFARYSHGEEDGDLGLNLIEVGLNHYLYGHAAKVTIDMGFSFDEISSTWKSSGAGWLRDSGGEDGQFLLRSQVQFLF